jgi:hypothetical protein
MIIVAPMTIARLAVAVLICVMLPADFSRAAEPTAMDFVVALDDKPCDETNRAWSVLNQHTYLSIQVKVQWQPVGGMQKEETIVLPPQKRVPVGCAPSVKIISAELMQF